MPPTIFSRRHAMLGFAALSLPGFGALPALAATEGFAAFLAGLWPLAQAQGVSRETFDEAFRGVTLDASVVALTKKQSEFVKPIWSYLDGAVNASRINRGQTAAEQYATTLSTIEGRYGVPKEIVLGIWGMETNFGSFFGDKYIIRALASLAYARYRGTFFRDELIMALRILEEGHVERSGMRGSWAGAMGHTQFMPSSFLKHAVDFNGDGRKDIWNSIPDALASTANYLKNYGWVSRLPWGFEVELPQGFAFRTMRQDFAQWRAQGFERADGRGLPASGEARLFLPAGSKGPAFLVTANYEAIKAYNTSDAYALGVAHLGDRIAGRGPLQADWPRKEKLLSKAEGEEVQRRLTQRGFYRDKIDGKIGSGTREAVRQFQLSIGYSPADGHPDHKLLARLRATP